MSALSAAKAGLADAKPSGDNAFKIELARRVVARALALAAAGTPERMPALPGSPFAAVSGDVIHDSWRPDPLSVPQVRMAIGQPRHLGGCQHHAT